jgi:hypothetical protein
MRNITFIMFLFINVSVFAQTTKDSFSIVFTSKNDYVNIHKNYSENSEIIGRIPAGSVELKTTWKTYYFNDDFWVEIIYGDKKGYIKRKLITRGFDELTAKNAAQMDKMLLKVTSSIQQSDAFSFKDLVYSLRGIALYDTEGEKLFNYERKELNPMFANIDDHGSFEGIFFDSALRLLESNFFIQYNDAEIRKNLPVELSNFQFISITNEDDDLELCVGLENWNNVLYISYLALLNK